MNVTREVRRTLRLLVVLLALVASCLPFIATARSVVAGGGEAKGGVKLAPAVAPLDRTPFALEYGLAGLQPGAPYAVKARFNSESGSFGSTWNPSLRRWVYTSSSWSTQPTATASADGGMSGWLMVRAGRSESSTETTALLSVVLRREGTDVNVYPPAQPVLQVMPVGTDGLGLLHLSASAQLTDTASTCVLARDCASRIVGLTLSEPNGVDDDDNGVVDDESLLPARPSFRLAVPSSRLLSLLWTGKGMWPNQVAFGGFDLEVPRSGLPRAMTLSANPRTAVYGTRISFLAALSGASEETVTIEASCDGKSWVQARTGRTSADGTRRFSLLAARTLRYRAVWLGTPSAPPSLSRGFAVPVVPRISSRVRPRLLYRGRSLLVSGSFRPFKHGRRLKLLAVQGRACLARPLSLSSSSFAIRLRLLRPGPWRLSLLYQGDSELSRRLVLLGTVRVR